VHKSGHKTSIIIFTNNLVLPCISELTGGGMENEAEVLLAGLGFFPEERYFFPSDGKKWVFTGKKC